MTSAWDVPFRGTVPVGWGHGHLLVLRFRDSTWCDDS